MEYNKKDWEKLYKKYNNKEVSLAYVIATLCGNYQVTPAMVVKQPENENLDKLDFVFGEPKKGDVIYYSPDDNFSPKRMEGYKYVSFINLHGDSGAKKIPIIAWV